MYSLVSFVGLDARLDAAAVAGMQGGSERNEPVICKALCFCAARDRFVVSQIKPAN